MKDNTEKKENKILNFIIRLVMVIVAFILIVVVYNVGFNQNEYIDLNDPDLIETDDGYKKEVDFESTVADKEIIKDNKKKKYIIYCYDKNEKKYKVEVGNYIYSKLSIDEEIRVFGATYYNKKGLYLDYEYSVESLVDPPEDNGKEPPPEEPDPPRVPGVDYGDGVIW